MRFNHALSILIISFIMVLISACSENSSTEPELTLEQKLQKALDDAIKNYGGKGISAAVIIPGEYAWQGASGISHQGVPVTTSMLFSAGSISKTFTAATIMHLDEEGILSLDDSLSSWLPDYPYIDNTITIRQLLQHTSGIFNITENPAAWQDFFANPDKLWDPDQLIRTYQLEPYFEKGTGWTYSNTGYILLRMIIEKAGGIPIAEVYRNRFFTPLALESAYTAPFEDFGAEKATHGWLDWTGDGVYEDLSVFSLKSFYSAAMGGVWCSAEDLAKWARAIFVDHSAVSQEVLNQMTDFYSPITSEPLLDGYGLGLVRFSPELFNGLQILGHSGDAPGFAAGCLYLPDYNICLGIADNTEEGDTMWVINDLLNILVNEK